MEIKEHPSVEKKKITPDKCVLAGIQQGSHLD